MGFFRRIFMSLWSWLGNLGGGGASLDWEIVYSVDIPDAGPFPINTGVFYDPSYEYVIGGMGLAGQAKTGGEFVHPRITGPDVTGGSANMLVFISYSPNGGVTGTLTGGGGYLASGGVPDAPMGVRIMQASPTITFDPATSEFIITGLGGPPSVGYAVIARRRMV
jgi:hypothetical protein